MSTLDWIYERQFGILPLFMVCLYPLLKLAESIVENYINTQKIIGLSYS